MTLLGILFVLGVAFMATMNFESQMMVSQSQRNDGEKSASTMTNDMGAMMYGTIMSAPSVPFSASSVVDSHGVYAELPGVHGSFSSIEPLPNPGPNGIIEGFSTGSDDVLNDSSLTAYVNPSSVRGITSTYPTPTVGNDTRPPTVVLNSDPRAKDFVILTRFPPGTQLACWPVNCAKRCTDDGRDCSSPTDCANNDCRALNLQRCIGGPNDGMECIDPGGCNVAGTTTFACEGPRLLDADGDGVSDSIGVNARDFGFTDTQLATLGPQLNPKSKPGGRVVVAFRIVPHGGMVDLNSAHPKLIENALTVPDLHIPADVAFGNFKHGPSGPARGLPQYAYPPESEERLLRRRNMLPSLSVAPSMLLGNSFAAAGAGNVKSFQGDMPWQMLGPKPGGAASGNYQSVDPNDPFSHRYWPYGFQVVGNAIQKEPYSRAMADAAGWDVGMEPNTAAFAEPATASNPVPAYNRNHLSTTVSYDGLVQPGGKIGNDPNASPSDDILAKMTAANFTANDPDFCVAAQQSTLPAQFHVLPFEYPDYPDTIVDECCVTDPSCRLNPRKGKLQLSLEWLQPTCSAGANAGRPCRNNLDCSAPGICQGILIPPDPTNPNPANLAAVEFYHRTQRLIYDVFAMLLNNALSSPYFADIGCDRSRVPTDPDADCSAGEYCDQPAPPALGVCRDMWTNQKHSVNQLTRTAASLTANLIDYADADDVPTRVAIRDLDFNEAELRCYTTANPDPGALCRTNADCPSGSTCQDKRTQLGREIDTNPGAAIELHYMYGLEKQPFITEVATHFANTSLDGWAVEIFNPFNAPINLTDSYFLYQVKPGATAPTPPQEIQILAAGGTIAAQFTTFITASGTNVRDDLLGTAPAGTVIPLTGTNALNFEKDWTLYLVRRHLYPGDPTPTDIVLDQVVVHGDCIGDPAPNVVICPPAVPNGPVVYSIERSVEQASYWKALVDRFLAEQPVPFPVSTLGTWTNAGRGERDMRPVELFFSNTGVMGGKLTYGGIPAGPIVPAYPTTGSMLLLMRHANRAITDYYYAPPPPGTTRTVKNLAFTTRLAEEPVVKLPSGALANPPKVPEWQQIDNGRMPVFDVGTDGTVATPGVPPPHFSMHHILPTEKNPPVDDRNKPGELSDLPWGQLVFDYFTALPLSNPGPYFDTVFPANDVAAADAQPRVDLDGLRVQGRININAAPWRVLAGLPFRPLQYFPMAAAGSPVQLLGDRIKAALGPLAPATGTTPDAEAGTLGDALAQSIVAYRDLRAFAGTGNYSTGQPTISVTPPGGGVAYDYHFGRGWLMRYDPAAGVGLTSDPAVRRGTGFLTVGELANVRHTGSTAPALVGAARTQANYPNRFDAGNIDPNSNATGTDYLSAVATLVALGDWVTVRSDVFTVYGVLRGEEDTDILDNNAAKQQLLRAQDADSRALRFQETIDRLPTLLGDPRPRRIGERTISNYADFRND